MMYYLGVPKPSWLQFIGVPSFVSRNTLRARKSDWLPSPVPIAIDSGGFSELTPMPGSKKKASGWKQKARSYAAEMDFYRRMLVNVDWIAPQDWMTEDKALENTGMSLREHQILTTNNFLELESAAPWMHFVPVLQGRTVADYLRHADDYERAGIRLETRVRVGVGSVCRRQGCNDSLELLKALHERDYQLHAFGFSTLGVRRGAQYLASADSMAWSDTARKQHILLPGHDHTSTPKKKGGIVTNHCNNCMAWSLVWRQNLLDTVPKEYVERHPKETIPPELQALWTKELVSSKSGFPTSGMPTPPRLAMLVEECRFVVETNRTLDEEEEVEEDLARSKVSRMPPTWRAVLAPQTRWELEALDAKYLAGLGQGTQDVIRVALAMRESGGPRVALDPTQPVLTRSGRTIKPANCLPKTIAARTVRAAKAIGACDPSTAGWVLSQWQREKHGDPPRIEDIERKLGITS